MSHWLMDEFAEHPKVIGLSDKAFRFHVVALGFCSRNLTDGHVSERASKVIAAVCNTTPKRWTAELVAARLWTVDEEGDGFRVHDYLKHNPTAEQVKARRASNAERQKRWRENHRDEDGTFTHTNADSNAEDNGVSNRTLRNTALSSPLPPLALANPPTSSSYDEEGGDAFASGRIDELYRACGNTVEGSERIRRAIQARRPSFETIARAIDAAKSPCDSPLAVALAIIAPKKKGAA